MGTAAPTQRWSRPDLDTLLAGETQRVRMSQAGKLPGHYYLAIAGVTSALSLGLKLGGRGKLATFVAQFVAPVLLIGLYDMLMNQSADVAEHKDG